MKINAAAAGIIIGLITICPLEVDAEGNSIIKKLEAAACAFDGRLAGDVYEPSLVSTKAFGGTVYVFNMEGCGGGNHFEAYIGLVKNDKVVTSAPVEQGDSLYIPGNEDAGYNDILQLAPNSAYKGKGSPSAGPVKKITVQSNWSCGGGKTAVLHNNHGAFVGYFYDEKDGKLYLIHPGC